jgi:hypothetical protein
LKQLSKMTSFYFRNSVLPLKLTRLLLLILLAATAQLAQSQSRTANQKLPSPQKVIEAHLKAIGGKKNVAAVRSASYDWILHAQDQPDSTARWLFRAPNSVRNEMTVAGRQFISAANASSAWIEESGSARTLTDAEAANVKLRAVLDANRMIDFKKANVLARIVSLGDLASEPSYIVEFSHKGGAKLTYWFSLKSRLLVKILDDAARTTTRFADYRLQGSILEPHQVRIKRNRYNDELTLELQSVTHNSPLSDASFDPPRGDASLDVTSLLRAVGHNQEDVEKRVNEYSFVQKQTEREFNDQGEIKKETVTVYEVFPVANREAVMKLISENGVPLSVDRAAREERRVSEEFEKADRDHDKNQERAERRRAERRKRAGKGKEDDDPDISQFLVVCEFVAPRRERFRDREAVVFDFRPRPGFKPGNRAESLIAKLVGVVWIDPLDKQVMRLEARLAEGFKMGGGLLISVRPGAGVVMEQTRMTEGVWLPSFAQINLSVKVLLFGGGDINQTIEWSDYRHFSGEVRDYKVGTPKTPNQPDQKPF